MDKAVALIEHMWQTGKPLLRDTEISRMAHIKQPCHYPNINGQYEIAMLILKGAIKSAKDCLDESHPDLLSLQRALVIASGELDPDTPPSQSQTLDDS